MPSHCPGSAFAWVPSRKAVFAGDMPLTDFHPSCLTTFDAKAREVAKTSASAEAIVAELKKVLPSRSQGGTIGANVNGMYLGRQDGGAFWGAACHRWALSS